MQRPAAVALALALLACGEDDAQDCPGEPVARFHFTGARVARGDPAVAAIDPVPDAADCAEPLAYPSELVPFDGTLSAEPANPAGALCLARGPVLLGERSGDHYVVETGSAGAVLGKECADTCSAALRLVVAGDVVRVDGAPASFSGVLVEVMSALAEGTCGACSLPCAARYLVAGTR